MTDPPIPYDGDDPYVFVSYAHADKDIVFAEITRLLNSGIRVWYDTTGIRPGSEWNDEIAKAIKGAVQFLYFVTPASVASEHCRRELSFAQSENRSIVVCHLQETEIPDGLRLSLDNRQAILKHQLQADDYHQLLIHSLSPGMPGPSSEFPGKQYSQGGLQTSGFSPGGFSPRGFHVNAPLAGGLIATALILLAGIAWWLYSPPPEIKPDTAAVNDSIAIAVLPFENLSNDAEQAFFSDGIAEDILNELAKIRRITVRPRSSSFALRSEGLDLQTMGERLNVTHILEGSVRRSGNRIRVNAQLNDVTGNRSVWSDRYERELTDVFAVQDAIVSEILAALDVQLGGAGSDRFNPSIEAYEAFLLGRHYYNQYQFNESDRWLEAAIEADPTYADAWAYMAQNIAWRTAVGFNASTGVHVEKRTRYIKQALKLDPNNTTALSIRALSEMLYTDREYEQAVNELIRIITVYPNNEGAYFYLCLALSTIGKDDLNIKVAEKFAALSPESSIAQLTRATTLIRLGSLAEARAAVAAFERRFNNPLPGRILALATKDVASLEKILAGGSLDVAPPVRQYLNSMLPYIQGDRQQARALVSPLRSDTGYIPFLVKSWVALVKQDLDSAFENYYLAVEAAEPSAIQGIQGRAELEQVFPEFYEDPRYAEMLKHFGLDAESIARMELRELPF